MPALHALGDSDLVLTLQQRNGAHLSQIQPNRIIVSVEHSRGKVEFVVFWSGTSVGPFNHGGLSDNRVRNVASGYCGGDVLVDPDPDSLESGAQIFNFLRQDDLGGQNMIHLVGE